MKYYLDDDKINIRPTLLKYVAAGIEGKVYRYNDSTALKIFHNNVYEETMSAETCVMLKQIETKRILLPRKMLLDKSGEFRGYTTNFISNNKYVYDVQKEKLIDELKEIKKELEMISNHHVLIDDWQLCNFMYDGMFRFIDPGMYEYSPNMRNFEVKKHNYSIFKDFVFYELIRSRLMGRTNNYMLLLAKMYIESRADVINFLKEEMNTHESINQYIKRIAKTSQNMV